MSNLTRIDYGIDTKNRIINFGVIDFSESLDNGGDVSWLSCELAVRGLKLLESESNKPIEIHMSSPGGDPFYMLRLYDHIQKSSCQIKFFGSGLIASSATWIMAGCDERYLDKHTWILIHDSPATGERTSPIKLTDYEIDVGMDTSMQDQLNRIYAQNSKMPKEFWDQFVKRDLWLSAEEAIYLGLADELIEPKKRGNVRKKRAANLKEKPDAAELKKIIEKLRGRVHLPNGINITVNSCAEESDESLIVPEEVIPVIS